MADETPTQQFDDMLARVRANSGELGRWNDRVDWQHGANEMAGFYQPLLSGNQLYVEWIYGRLSSLFNAVMIAAASFHRDTGQESALEMLFGRTIADLQAVGFLVSKGYYPQAYAAARMTYECCDLADLFWMDPAAGSEWFTTKEAHRDFSRRRVRERLSTAGASPQDDNDIYAIFCERSHPRWQGLRHTLIEPHKAATEALSDVDAAVFRWDAGFWVLAAVWRMALRLRYVQAGMPPDPDVADMLTNLNATAWLTLGFHRRRIERSSSPQQREPFVAWHDRVLELLQLDGVTIARRVEKVPPR